MNDAVMALRHPGGRWLLCLVLGSLAILAWADTPGRRDVLRDIVAHCLDASMPGYCAKCRSPQQAAACAAAAADGCRGSTEVWALAERFAAIRDIKECACPGRLVHGLALPRAPVSGIEDPSRPDAIWQFAWDAARGRLPPEQIALAVNPKGLRSQDQLHVHLLRLRPDARTALAESASVPVSSLDEVWRTAAATAERLQWRDYGVLVAAELSPSGRTTGRYLVVASAGSPEALYTVWACD